MKIFVIFELMKYQYMFFLIVDKREKEFLELSEKGIGVFNFKV